MNLKINLQQLAPSWFPYLEDEFEKPYMKNIRSFLESEIRAGKTIYPHPKSIFYALNMTHFDDVKVVIIGQDPYHGENQAHGLCFSVQDNVALPPSLKNIYKEIESDLGIKKDFSNGNLTNWAQQGVLLLNAILSVEANKPASHSHIGWQNFTDTIIKTISDKKKGVVFLLRGNFAQKKRELIDTSKHYILEAAHPSPFSAYKGFFGCKHFSKTNALLKKQGKKEIKW